MRSDTNLGILRTWRSAAAASGTLSSMTLISRSDRTVPATVQARSRRTPAEAFAVIVPGPLALIYEKWGPFPATREARDQTGAWDGVGQSRTLVLGDGTTLKEVIVEFQGGRTFSYEATEFTNALGRLIHGVRGDWTFIEDGTGSIVRWTWEFKPRPFCRLPVRLLLVPLFRNYMQRAVGNAVRLADRS
ncbi:SRPBCC family protein [Naasia lichenicola]|uniref:SRPBCC family protein n=1 Tax=Naasia lichenicola TaxID=2565933 RepID=A0A4S4FQU9_9MICO|nr:SRPBCC family protein [Naasia lichenicola]THG32959.1 SRPBCC family protein [Naasia lichenicola]